jgi:hypothetical protein
VGENPTASATAQVGDTLAVDVVADLGGLSASGAALFIGIPDDIFKVINSGASQTQELRPFRQGPFFHGAVEFSNDLTPREEVPDFVGDLQLLSYAALFGPGQDRGRSGAGVVATFHLLCVRPVAAAPVHIAHNPVHETRLVLADGHGERFFRSVQGLEIAVEPAPSRKEGSDQTWGRLKARFAGEL